MTQPSNDIAQIVAGLTKAQREAIRRQPISHQEWAGRHTSIYPWQVWMDVGRPMLHGRIIAFNENPRRSDTHFTALGLQVRAALEGEGRDNG